MEPKTVAQCEYTYPESEVQCPDRVSQKVYDYSIKKYGKVLCWGHQKQIDMKEKFMDKVEDQERKYGEKL